MKIIFKIIFSAKFVSRIIIEIAAALSISLCASNCVIINARGFGAGGAKYDTAEIVIIELTKK